MSVCAVCGLSQQGSYENVGLGIDEAPRFVICECNSELAADTRLQFAVDSFAYANSLISGITVHTGGVFTTHSREDAHESNIVDVDEQKSVSECEVTFSRAITQSIRERMPALANEGYYREVGSSILCKIRNERSPRSTLVNGKVRKRIHLLLAEDTVKVQLAKMVLCPGMVYSKSSEFTVDSSELKRATSDGDRYEYHTVTKTWTVGLWKFILRSYDDDTSQSCEAEYLGPADPTDEQLITLVTMVSSSIMPSMPMRYNIATHYLKSLRSSSAPTKDVAGRITGDFVYRVKADGEHNWLIDGGCIWYLCRNDIDLSVVGLVPKVILKEYIDKPVVLRVEVLSDGSLLFIDVLSAPAGVMPISRSVRSSYLAAATIDDLPRSLLYRRDFDSHDEVVAEATTTLIPNDGILMINSQTSATYRLKEPTVDLKVLNGYACTIDEHRTYVRRFKAHVSMDEGKVYECVLVRCKLNRRLRVKVGAFHIRHDKVLPNEDHIFRAIRKIALSRGDDKLVFSNEVSAYSFQVRDLVYYQAIRTATSGSLIIDVGTGRGQSMTVMDKYKNTSWLFIDPNLSDKFVRALGQHVDCTNYSATSLCQVVKDMNQGKVLRAVYRGKIEDLISHREMQNLLCCKKVPFVFAFSASYCVDSINFLRRWNIPCVGCLFTYDQVDSRGYIFDQYGLQMRVVDQGIGGEPDFIGVARLGEGASFREPPITSDRLQGLEVHRSSVLVPTEQYSDQCQCVVKHMSIFYSF